jgi:hypothetical protein
MNQFTKTTIVNSFDKKDFLKLLGINPEYVCEAYRHDGCWGRKEVAKVTLPKDLEGLKVNEDVIRMEIKLHTVGAHLGEFQNALTRNSELFTYEALWTKDGMSKVAEGLVKAAKSHRNTSKNFDFEMSAEGNVLTLTAGADYIRFKEIDVNKVSVNYTGYEAQEDLIQFACNKADDAVVITPGMNGFGDTAWLINNFQLPTYVNTNWMALHQDERPIPGKLYNQFTLHAVADRGELTGMGAVGQKLASKTTHVFYVLADLSKDFEKAINTLCVNLTKEEGAESAVVGVGVATPNDGSAEPLESYKVPVEVETEPDENGVIFGERSTKNLMEEQTAEKVEEEPKETEE